MVTRIVAIVLALAAAAEAHPVYLAEAPEEEPTPPHTWLSNDEAIGEMVANGRWTFWGTGLAIDRELIGHLEVSLEGQALRLDASEDQDRRHGFALRGGVSLGYRFAVSHLAGIDWGVEPAVGVASSAIFGIAGDRAQHEVFADIRGSFRAVIDHHPQQYFLQSRALGGHVALRLTRAQGELDAAFLVGYDWGL
jgi:hypothetical protein